MATNWNVAQEESLVGVFLAHLFDQLDETGIPYAVLRNYAGLPQHIDHDIDLLVADLDAFERTALQTAAMCNWKFVKAARRYAFLSLYFLSQNQECNKLGVIKLDAWSPSTWKGIEFINQEILQGRRRHPNHFYILAPGAEAALSLMKSLIYHGKVQDKYKPLIPDMVQSDRASFTMALGKGFGRHNAKKLTDLAARGDWVAIERLAPPLRRQAVLRALTHQPISQIGHWLAFLWGHWRNVVHPSGLFIVLIGPDGSGKSTVSKGLCQYLQPLFSNVRYYHAHFEILPRLRELAKLFGVAPPPEKPAAAQGTLPPPEDQHFHLGPVHSLVNLIYYSMDYLFGYPVIARARAQGELIIFDRYYYDYLIQPGMSLSRWLRFAPTRIIPKPDMVVYLKNNPHIILARKAELRHEELERQRAIYEELAALLPQGLQVETTGTPEETIRRVAQALIARMVTPAGSEVARKH